MDEYPKINTIWKRTERGQIIEGEFATPELSLLRDVEWEWTEKVDGTNVRVGWDGESVEFGGRTANSQMHTGLIAALLEMFPEEKLRAVFDDGPTVLYGEGYGAKIQKGGGNYSPVQTFVLFDVTVGDWWLRRADVRDVGQKLDVETIPTVRHGGLLAACEVVQAGLTSTWGEFPAEGLVGRPIVDLCDRRGQRIIAKIKTRDYGA